MPKNLRLHCILIWSAIFSLSSFSSAREWNDVTGKHRFNADLIRVNADRSMAWMLGPDGRRYEIPLSALQESDQAYAIAFAEAAEKKTAEKNAALAEQKKTKKSGGNTWTNVPEEILFEMKQEAARQFPYDEDEQFSYIKASVDNYLGQGNSKSERKRTDSKKTKPTPATQSKGRDKSGMNGVPTAVVEMLTTQADGKWPTNERKRTEFVQKQLGYYYVLQKFETPDLPKLAVIQLKHNASKIAPTDYKAQLRYVYEQVLAGREYLAKQAASN